MRHLALLIVFLTCVAVSAVAQAQPGTPNSLLFAWMKDNDGEDPSFLAVIDSDPDSQSYGELLTTSPTPMALTDAQRVLPASDKLFANAYADGRTFVFDVNEPFLPSITAQFEAIEGYSHPHSFVELESGNVLVTFQTSGEENNQVGGLLEMTPDAELVRSASAADPSTTRFIRPYSLTIAPDVDRVISSSLDMQGIQATEHIQLWQLSDLRLLDTIRLPAGDRRNVEQLPLDIQLLDDGRSALLVTWNCGLYHLTGIGGRTISAELVWDFSSRACAMPLKMGDFWLQAVGDASQIVVLDIENPAQPQLATIRQLPEGFRPNWMAAEPGGDRIVLTGLDQLSDRIVLMSWDERVETLSLTGNFGTDDGVLAGFRTDRKIWPHGKTGSATAHGVVFWPAQ